MRQTRKEEVKQVDLFLYRYERDLPIQVAARLADVSQSTWSLWERWGIPPKSYTVAKRIADLVGKTPEELGWERK